MDKANTEGPRYKGFSSVSSIDGTFMSHSRTETYDIELVKQDLLNHFNVRYREIPGRPGFGCSIYNVMAQPFDDITEALIKQEVERVIRSDPRVKLTGLVVDVDRDNHTMVVSAVIRYLELEQDEIINFSVSQT